MKTFSLNKIFAIFALLFLIGGGKTLARSGDPKTLPITNYSPNGSKFYSDFTIDWTTQKLQIIVDVTNCTTDASGNNPDDIFDLCPQTTSDVEWNSPTPVVHVYCDGTQLKLRGNKFTGKSDLKPDITLGSSYDKTNITIEIDNENGLTVNGNSTTLTATFLTELLNNSNLTFASQEGSGRMHGTYKSVKVVSKTAPSGIVTSTNETTPEHVFTMRNANGDYVNSNLYRTLSASDYAQFAFYEISGKTNAYYIYNYSAKKWLKYTTGTTYTAGKDFVSNGEKSERSEFYITSTAKNGVNGVQIQPYNAAGNAANNYLNFHGGGDQNTNHTIGNYTDNGSSDAGSLWVFTEVEIANNNAVITNKTMSEGSVVSTVLENHTGDGTKFTRDIAIDWTKQKVIAEIDLSTCGTGTEDLFSIGKDIQTFKENNIHMYKTTGGISAYVAGNHVGGGITSFGPSSFDGNILRVELSSEKGFVVNDRVIFSKEVINQYSEQYYSKQFFSLSNIQVGSCEGTDQESRAKYNYISVVTNDYKTATVTSSNTLDEVAVNTFNAQNDVDVQLKRTLSPEYWNTFCVPFTISADVIKEKFGEGTQVCTFGSMEGTVMNFAHSTSIEAGKPYIVKPTKEVVDPTFTGVNIEAVAAKQVGANGYFMQGIYSVKTDLTTDGTNLFLGDGNKFYKPLGTTTAKMKGMRAYFIVPQGTNFAALRANIDGATTAIDELATVVEQPTDNRIYNLQGQFVGTSFEGLHGVYVQNGKKVLVK
jgi:hypothetical protein